MSAGWEYLASMDFTEDQRREITQGMKEGVDVSVYAKPEFLAIQMREIRLGLAAKLPAEQYADPKYDWFQMQEIRKGLENGVDVTKYRDPAIPFDVMRQIRHGLKEGHDFSAGKTLPAGILKELRKAVRAKVDIVGYIRQGYGQEQLKQIRLALKNGVKLDPYLSLSHRGVSLREIRLGLEEQIDVSLYAREEISWQQMREIRIGLTNRLNVMMYLNPFYSWQQMREIRLGMEDNLPVETYSGLMNTAQEMHRKRLALLKDREKEKSEERLEADDFRNFSLLVSADEMEAMILLNERGKKIESAEIFAALNQRGVVHGIDYNAVNEICEGRTTQDIVPVAKGTEPACGRDGWYEFFFETDVKGSPKLLEDGSVDYQNIKWFEIVQKGQRVAVYHHGELGEPGSRVTGGVIPGLRGKELPLLAGRGFTLMPDKVTYVAEMDGKIELKGNRLEVTNVLILDNVTLATGNIDFSGSVYIRGTVGDGVRVRAEKDILVDGFIEAAFLEAGEDIILRKGNNAGGKGALRAGNDVCGRFFENASVTAGGDIKANYCLNSELSSEGRVEIAGREGSLAGGSTYAALGVQAYNIGNEAGLFTMLKIGRRSRFLQEEAELAERERVVNQELLLLKNAYLDFQKKYPPERRNSNPTYLKLEDAIYTKELEMGKIQKKKDKMDRERGKFDKAKIVAGGTIFAGVQIDINGAQWNAREIKGVTLKKQEGRVSIYSYR